MVEEGETIDLGIPVKAVVNGKKWEGTLSDLISRPTLISVYMRNNTSSCDKQAQQLGVVAGKLADRGVDVIGLSKDTVGSHLRYAQRNGFAFPLVSDPEHQFSRAAKSLVEKKMYGRTFLGPSRSAYLIDPQGRVLGVQGKVDASSHGEEALALAARIR